MNYILLALLLSLYFFWINTQIYLSTDVMAINKIVDRIHDSDFVNQTIYYLETNHHIASIHMILTTILIDITIVGVMVYSLWSDNFRAPILLLVGIILRQICQFINRLPI